MALHASATAPTRAALAVRAPGRCDDRAQHPHQECVQGESLHRRPVMQRALGLGLGLGLLCKVSKGWFEITNEKLLATGLTAPQVQMFFLEWSIFTGRIASPIEASRKQTLRGHPNIQRITGSKISTQTKALDYFGDLNAARSAVELPPKWYVSHL